MFYFVHIKWQNATINPLRTSLPVGFSAAKWKVPFGISPINCSLMDTLPLMGIRAAVSMW